MADRSCRGCFQWCNACVGGKLSLRREALTRTKNARKHASGKQLDAAQLGEGQILLCCQTPDLLSKDLSLLDCQLQALEQPTNRFDTLTLKKVRWLRQKCFDRSQPSGSTQVRERDGVVGSEL